jgi:hypothetical protein
MKNYSRNDKNKQLTLLSTCKLALTARNKLFTSSELLQNLTNQPRPLRGIETRNSRVKNIASVYIISF